MDKGSFPDFKVSLLLPYVGERMILPESIATEKYKAKEKLPA